MKDIEFLKPLGFPILDGMSRWITSGECPHCSTNMHIIGVTTLNFCPYCGKLIDCETDCVTRYGIFEWDIQEKKD
jgi:C4-type Zn-finger protein